MRKKNIILWTTSTIVVVLILIFIVTYPILFQEGNPIPILKGITALNKDNNIVQISKEPKRYLTKTDEGSSLIIKLMEKEGWKFGEQFGAGYMFLKDDSKLTITSTQYTGKYTIWEFGRGRLVLKRSYHKVKNLI